jgi:hypothetical protein
MPSQFQLLFPQPSHPNSTLYQELHVARGQPPCPAQDLQLVPYHSQGTMLLNPAGKTFQNSVSASQSILILFKNSPIKQS